MAFAELNRLQRAVLVMVSLASGVAGCVASPPRPDYRGASVELQVARRLLDEPDNAAPIAPEAQAAMQIDTAVALIHERVQARGTDIASTHPDPASNRVERVHYALQHLDAARLLLTHEEYDADRHVVRNEAISCIARAEEALGRTLEALLR